MISLESFSWFDTLIVKQSKLIDAMSCIFHNGWFQRKTISDNFIGKHLCWSLFLRKLRVSRPATLSKRNFSIDVSVWNLQNLRTSILKLLLKDFVFKCLWISQFFYSGQYLQLFMSNAIFIIYNLGAIFIMYASAGREKTIFSNYQN